MSVELIRRPVRRDAVYDRMLDEIRQAIVSRTLPPRSRILSETELCERYGISRVSVRTALAKLEKGGLIVKKNGLGSFVSDPDDPAFSPQPEVCDIAINITDVNLGVYWYYAKIQRAAAAAAPLYNAKLSMNSTSCENWSSANGMPTDCVSASVEFSGSVMPNFSSRAALACSPIFGASLLRSASCTDP